MHGDPYLRRGKEERGEPHTLQGFVDAGVRGDEGLVGKGKHRATCIRLRELNEAFATVQGEQRLVCVASPMEEAGVGRHTIVQAGILQRLPHRRTSPMEGHSKGSELLRQRLGHIRCQKCGGGILVDKHIRVAGDRFIGDALRTEEKELLRILAQAGQEICVTPRVNDSQPALHTFLDDHP